MKDTSNRTEKLKNKRSLMNRSSGQAIAEGAAVGVFLTILGVGLLLLLYNTFVVTSYSQKLQVVADEVARNFAQSKYWLGMQRQSGTHPWEFDDTGTTNQDRASAIGDAMLRELHLLAPDAKQGAAYTFTVSPVSGDSTLGNIVTVAIKVDNLPLFTGGNTYIPSVISINSVGISSDGAAPPGGVAILNFYDPTGQSGHDHKSIRVPIYCANKEVIPAYPPGVVPSGPFTEGHNASGYLEAGVWQGEFPVAYPGEIMTGNLSKASIDVETYASGAPLPKNQPSQGGAAQEVEVQNIKGDIFPGTKASSVSW